MIIAILLWWKVTCHLKAHVWMLSRCCCIQAWAASFAEALWMELTLCNHQWTFTLLIHERKTFIGKAFEDSWACGTSLWNCCSLHLEPGWLNFNSHKHLHLCKEWFIFHRNRLCGLMTGIIIIDTHHIYQPVAIAFFALATHKLVWILFKRCECLCHNYPLKHSKLEVKENSSSDPL